MIYCSGCGGALRFDIASQQMVCEMCGGQCDPAQTAGLNKDAEGRQVFETYSYLCPSCGGELLTTDKTDAIGFCPFCGGASMLFDRIRQQWEPAYVIPFGVTKEQCKEAYLKYARRSIFASGLYRNPQLIDGFRGIYMPYYCYRAIQRGDFTMDGVHKGVFTNSFYRIRGNTDIQLNGYAHDAAKSFDDRMSENIAPFDPAGHKPFAPGYLSGFYADVGDVNAKDYHKKGIDCMNESTVNILAEDKSIKYANGALGAIKVKKASAKIPTKIVDSDRVLYPVWFMSYRNKDKITYAAVNGQTGKVTADLPLSPWKILIAVLLLGAVLAAAMFALPSVKANATLLLTVILLVVGTIILHASYSRATGPLTGLGTTEEAQRFKKREKRRYLLVAVSAALGLLIAYFDPAYNWITYAVCIVMALELFYIMYCHIRFQAEIAKREPPQCKKKGAAYDEQ